MADKVIYLVQYEYVDEPGSFWPARAFPRKDQAERYALGIYSAGTRLYSVVPLILDSGQ